MTTAPMNTRSTRPPLRRLVWLMSLAGLGVSLCQPAVAYTDASAWAEPAPVIRLARGVDAEAAAWSSQPVAEVDPFVGPLTGLLRQADDDLVAATRRAFEQSDTAVARPDPHSSASDSAPLSQADREANALAQVSIAEPPALWLPAPLHPPAPGTPPALVSTNAIQLRQPVHRGPAPKPLLWVGPPDPDDGPAEPTLGADIGSPSASGASGRKSAAKAVGAHRGTAAGQARTATRAHAKAPTNSWRDALLSCRPSGSESASAGSHGSLFPNVQADRVMQSLAALISGDEPQHSRFGSRAEAAGAGSHLEDDAVSHADKTLRDLASVLRQSDSKRSVILERAMESSAPMKAAASRQAPATAAIAQGVPAAPTAVLPAFLRPAPVAANVAPVEPAEIAEIAEIIGKAKATENARAAEFAEPTDQAPARLNDPRQATKSPLSVGLVALSDSKLNRIRGGFVTDNGLQISFGIERAVYINGALVTSTSLNVSDLGKTAGGQAQPAPGAASVGNLALIQTGAGNTFSVGPVSAATVGTVVQKIQTLTLINASVNSLQIMKSNNFASSLRSAVTDSLRR